VISIGGNQQIGQLVSEVVLTDEWVSQQCSEHPFPPAVDGGGKCQVLVRRDVRNQAGTSTTA
jgi:hypothetical protein